MLDYDVESVLVRQMSTQANTSAKVQLVGLEESIFFSHSKTMQGFISELVISKGGREL